MKQTIPKSLILSFFLIGIILGLLFLDGQMFSPAPAPVAVQPSPEAKTAPKPRPKTATKPAKQPVREKVEKALAKVLPETPAEPAPQVVEPFLCDRAAAQQVRLRAREIAEITEAGGNVNVRLGSEWAFFLGGHRASFVQAFSEADSCLAGRPRLIRFFFEGREVAVADPVTGVRMRSSP